MHPAHSEPMRILHKMQQLDVMLFNTVFYHSERGSLRSLAKAASRSADGYLYLLVPATLSLAGAAEIFRLLQLIVLALATERALYWLLKNSLRRRRPQDYITGFRSLITAGDQFSFPSGHTSASFLLATCMTLVYQEPAAPLYIWASCVGLSRVILGVHYPGDTLAGAVMGSSIALLAGTLIGT